MKGIKNALGATVNDVVMAACAGGLRSWLEAHDALPDTPLIAMVPVSIRSGEETEKWTNRVSGIFAALPTDEPDPLERVAPGARRHGGRQGLARRRASRCPHRLRSVPTAGRLRSGHAHGHPADHPVRPRQPLYTAGARMLHYYPVSTIVDGQGLNITVQSYLDTLDFGLVACRELVPDLWDMVDAIVDDLEALGKATGVDIS